MTPKQLSRLAGDKARELESKMAEADRRTFDEKVNDCLREFGEKLRSTRSVLPDLKMAGPLSEYVQQARQVLNNAVVPEHIIADADRCLGEIEAGIRIVKNEPDLITAHHESGHFVLAYVCGAKLGRQICCCECEVPHKGKVWGFAEIENHPSVVSKAISWMAGPLAELRFVASQTKPRDIRFDPSFGPGWGDRLERGRVLIPWDAQTSAEFAETYELLEKHGIQHRFQACLSQAQTLLNGTDVWTAVENLANDLYAARLLDGDRATEIIAGLVQPLPKPPQ